MSSLSDQLLKAGLVTEEQVKKAAEKPKRHKAKNYSKKKAPQSKKRSTANSAANKEKSDLAKFYNQRASLERTEKQEAAKKKQEAARLKKETNEKINKLLTDNLLNDEKAEIRYNFVVGTTIKYLFVTEEQQQKLADGKLAISFLGGKRALIPVEVAKQITAINPNKIVIMSDAIEDEA